MEVIKITEKLRRTFDIKLNSISETGSNTKSEVEFILHDFETSLNNTVISKDVTEKALNTIKDMPIVCQYYPSEDGGDDALGDHAVSLGKYRDGVTDIVELNTMAIGVFTEPAYFKEIVDENGDTKEVVAAKGVLWKSRYPNVVGLLFEWLERDVDIVSSVELTYYRDDFFINDDDVEELKAFEYEGHCILNSEDRGVHSKVQPAYDVSKLTRLVAQALIQEKEDKYSMSLFKKAFQLSHKDMEQQLYNALGVSDSEYGGSWIVDVFEDYVVVNEYSWEEGNSYDKYFKYNYTRQGDVLTVDKESKSEVMSKRSWIETTEVEQLESQVNELQEQIKEVNSTVEVVKQEKLEVEKQFNEATEKLTVLNQKVEELEPFKEQLEKSQYEANLQEVTESYEKKFKALNQISRFEEDDVKKLLEKAAFATDEGVSAKSQLNSILVDLVPIELEEKDTAIKQHSSKRENLSKTDSIIDKYFLK